MYGVTSITSKADVLFVVSSTNPVRVLDNKGPPDLITSTTFQI